jgi:hypothetical protein
MESRYQQLPGKRKKAPQHASGRPSCQILVERFYFPFFGPFFSSFLPFFFIRISSSGSADDGRHGLALALTPYTGGPRKSQDNLQ